MTKATKPSEKHILRTSNVLQSLLSACTDRGNCVHWLNHADVGGFRPVGCFGMFHLHLNSRLMRDPTLEIHGAMSVKLEGFSDVFVLLLEDEGITLCW